MSKNQMAIVWIQKDFRLNDNIALIEGSKFDQLVPVYIWNDKDLSDWKTADAKKWWLYQTLAIFKKIIVRIRLKSYYFKR